MIDMAKKHKKLDEMTGAEKTARISYLQQKLYDINYKPSILLQTELKRTDLLDDNSLVSGVQQLRDLEQHMNTLKQEYSIKFRNEMIPLVRGFEQQRSKLAKQHEQEYARAQSVFGMLHIMQKENILQKQEREAAELSRIQAAKKAELQKKLSSDMDKCRDEISAAFMKFVHQIYK